MRRIGGILMILGFLWFPFRGRAEGDSSWAEKQERVNTLIRMRLTQELGLNAAQSAQIGQVLKKYQERRFSLKKQLRDTTTELRAAAAAKNEGEIKKLLSQRSQTKSELDRIDDQMFSDVKPMLTPWQQAQFLIVMDEIKSEIRAIHRREGPPMFPGAFSTDPNAFPGAGNPNDPNAVNRTIQP